MATSEPARADHRWSAVVAVSVVAVAALMGVVAYGALAPASGGSAGSVAHATRAQVTSSSPPAAPSRSNDPADTAGTLPEVSEPSPSDAGGPIGAADGVIGDGVTVFRDDVVGVTNLAPTFLAALRRAATDAADDGVQFTIHSAWRSRAYQELLLQQAIAEHGSAEAAARWVAPPDRSAHVFGDAIDLEEPAASWLSEHGAAYGLCQIYDNETWHYELRPEAVQHGCPARYPDAAHDPRMR